MDCTYGNHYLHDYTTNGCKTNSGCSGGDHLSGLAYPLADYDYVFISEAGSNNSSFLTDALAVYKRFQDANPNVKCYYINHVYSVNSGHTNILNNLKVLHDQYGVDIINCGQLAYDIFKGNVKVPGGSVSYVDKYTFVNHGSDPSVPHHPRQRGRNERNPAAHPPVHQQILIAGEILKKAHRKL